MKSANESTSAPEKGAIPTNPYGEGREVFDHTAMPRLAPPLFKIGDRVQSRYIKHGPIGTIVGHCPTDIQHRYDVKYEVPAQEFESDLCGVEELIQLTDAPAENRPNVEVTIKRECDCPACRLRRVFATSATELVESIDEDVLDRMLSDIRNAPEIDPNREIWDTVRHAIGETDTIYASSALNKIKGILEGLLLANGQKLYEKPS